MRWYQPHFTWRHEAEFHYRWRWPGCSASYSRNHAYYHFSVDIWRVGAHFTWRRK